MCRYAAAKAPVEIGWWIGQEFKTAEMALRDISLSGASAVTRTPPPDSAPIWLRLNDPAQPDWVEAKVIAITTRFWGPALVRMKFREPCPYEFFKAAIQGMVPSDEAEDSAQAGRPARPLLGRPVLGLRPSSRAEGRSSLDLAGLAGGMASGQFCLTNFCARLPLISPA